MKAALWLRVSTDEQTLDNQRAALIPWVTSQGHEIVAEYAVIGSAYTGKHTEAWRRMMLDAGIKWQVLAFWSLDRIDRGGIASMLHSLAQLHGQHVTVLSRQEPWINVEGPLWELLVSVLGFSANYESRVKSERIKAAIARRRAQGLPVGRQPGAKDHQPRRRAGYVAREELRRFGPQ